ncbi:hypothetical protein CF15_07265 [Pyrodictium occultum]|uniref:Arsenic resistance protein n=1 Tax=Pyrodictium occultum TaxID=2309 RepID=A0A0V8RWR1_PYROC|nr:bile acid:sodium symporter [Pyrodictium occultum]KSW12510.1 hypothetical protein CF15_07265 [Pyrodictium occultum]
MPARVKRIAKNLSENMLQYTIIAIILGLVTGYYFNLRPLSVLITPVVLLMIYPMMVNLSLASLLRIRETLKPVLEALVLNFAVAPALIYTLVEAFHASTYMKIALMLLSVAPSCSMGLGYVGLAGGDMLTATTIVASAFLLSLAALPAVGYVAAGSSLGVPPGLILKSLAVVLVAPLVLGVAAREFIERRYGLEKYGELKPYFSTVTLVNLYLLIYLIFAVKARLVVSHYHDLVVLAPLMLVYYAAAISLLLAVNLKLLGLSYEQHQAVVFTTAGKNVALTIAVLATAFGKAGRFMAVYPAMVALIQPIVLILYLRYSGRVKAWFAARTAAAQRVPA